MRMRLAVIGLFCWVMAGSRAPAQDDYLTGEEVSAVRDAQEPDKRMMLWMDFAQRRIDSLKEALASPKSDSGRKIQKILREYVQLMESLESTIADARERRVPLSKGLKDVDVRGNLYLNYLKTLNSESIPGYRDFEYTLEEAMNMTKDELAEVAKGNYPDVKERTPPTDLPPPSARPPAKSQPSPPDAPPEEGPPRKSQRDR